MSSDLERSCFAIENSIKVRFLHALLHAIRDLAKHIVFVMQDDSDSLFDMIEQLCTANCFQFNMPTRDRHADAAQVEGKLSITIFSMKASPNIRHADAIICLDGIQDAEQIRQNSWAKTSDVKVVPVLHLVISRTVGNIERYLPSSLEKTERSHTIFASLLLIQDELGEPIDKNMPRAPDAAVRVAKWFQSKEHDTNIWPLGPIGRVEIL
jgi:hypothetical protein